MNRRLRIVALALLMSCQSTEDGDGYRALGGARGSSRYLPEIEDVWDKSSPQNSERAFRELIPNARKSGNLDYLLQVQTQMARAQGLQREFTLAHSTLDSVEEQLTGETRVAEVRYLLERGRVLNTSGSPERAAPMFEEAWEKAQAIEEHYLAVDAAHMVAIARPGSALAWNERALAYAESCGDERAQRWRGALYNNIGWTWHSANEFEKALAMFRKDFVFRSESKDEEGARIAKWSIAHTLRSMGRYGEALDMQRDLALEFEDLGRVDGYVHEELGELLLALGQSEPSKEQFRRAYDALSQDPNFVASNGARLERIRRLGGR